MDAYIKSDPLEVTFTRTMKLETESGAWVEVPPTTLDPQQFRLVPMKRRLYDYTNRTAQDGDIPIMQYTLVGRYNVDILRDDTFVHNGDKYKVISVEPKTNDRTRTDRVVAQIDVIVGDAAAPVMI